MLRRLEALLVVADLEHVYLLSGAGELIEPDDGIVAVGPAATSRWPRPGRSCRSEPRRRDIVQRSLEIAGRHLRLHQSQHDHSGAGDRVSKPVTEATQPGQRSRGFPWLEELTPRRSWPNWTITSSGRKKPRRRWRSPAQPLAPAAGPDELHDEIIAKNILIIGPTGWARPRSPAGWPGWPGAPFMKVEATKFTEVGYVGRDVESMVRDLVDAASHGPRAGGRGL